MRRPAFARAAALAFVVLSIACSSGGGGEDVLDDTLHFVDWDAEPGPAILRLQDLPRLESSGKLFARKFDVAVDSAVLDALDARAGTGP